MTAAGFSSSSQPTGIAGRVHRVGERDLVPVEARRAHVDRRAGAVGAAPMRPPAVSIVTLAACEQGDAARGIAAGFDLAAVGVPDAHADVGDVGRLEQDQLVAADAGAPVGDGARLRRVDRERALARVEDDEVVAEAVHLAKAERHVAGDLGAAPVQVHLAFRPLSAYVRPRPDHG